MRALILALTLSACSQPAPEARLVEPPRVETVLYDCVDGRQTLTIVSEGESETHETGRPCDVGPVPHPYADWARSTT